MSNIKRKSLRTKLQVLVGVLKSKKDLSLLLRERWYRIPVAFLPKREFTHLAFYQPAIFGRRGKCISYFARVTKKETLPRVALLPYEPSHPRAHDEYVKFSLSRIQKLSQPVKNIIPRRVSFGFTTLKILRSARDILELYGVPATEKILESRLSRLGIKTNTEHTVTAYGKHCRIDLAVWCRNGAIAIECDNDKAHSSKAQKRTDRLKDKFLTRLGWRVLRFKEKDIIERTNWCVAQVHKEICALGGVERRR